MSEPEEVLSIDKEDSSGKSEEDADNSNDELVDQIAKVDSEDSSESDAVDEDPKLTK